MKNQISLKENKIVIEKSSSSAHKNRAASFNANIMQLGYIMDEDLFEKIACLPEKEVGELYFSVITELKKRKGADVSYEPFYPNFPQQVMEMSTLELYLNAIFHYWSCGEWRPFYEKQAREIAFEETDFQVLSAMSEKEFRGIFTQKISSQDSISEEDKEIVEWFIDNYNDLEYPQIPFKENLCLVVAKLLQKGEDVTACLKTSTDVLRVVTYLSGGDISLAENTKFKSLPRKTRKVLCKVLEKIISEEDIQRHRNKWIRLFHSLHVGEYSEKLFKVAAKFRNNKKIETFNSKVEASLQEKNLEKAIESLQTRPGDFSRRLDHLLRLAGFDGQKIVIAFLANANKVSTRVLLQLLGHFKVRDQEVKKRVVFPKGSVQKAVLLKEKLESIDEKCCQKLKEGIEKILTERFLQLPSLGKTWIDPQLKNCPLPTQQRSASKSLFTVARGTRLPLGSKKTLRFFVYWVGEDIDLSASLHNKDFEMIEQISYTNLKLDKYESCHSGDIVSAPEGASEFIDISIDQALKFGARYVAMNVYVYAGPNFSEHEKCYVGWMTRNEVNSNEIYKPSTVVQKIDLACPSRNAIPCVFDLEKREMIWCDLAAKARFSQGGNNIESNAATTQNILEAIISLENKVTLKELLALHVKARGELVEDKEQADNVFTLDFVYKVSEINCDFIVDPVESKPDGLD